MCSLVVPWMDQILSTHLVAQADIDKKKSLDMAAEIEKKHLECVSRSYLNGVATFPLLFGTIFLSQRAFIKFVRPLVMATSSVCFAGAGTYFVITSKLRECQKSAKQQAETQARAIKA